MTLAIVFGCATAPVKAVPLRDGEGCAYSPLYVGQNGVGSERAIALITDIREVVAKNGQTIGYLYALADGTSTLQGNALMPKGAVRAYHLAPEGDGPLWTGVGEIDPHRIRERIVACRPRHIEHNPVRGARIQADAYRAYRSGQDFIYDPAVR